MAIVVSVINASSSLSDADIEPVVTALQTQVSRDFAPAWGATAALNYVAKRSKPDPKSWWLVLLDDADQANALGYHDVTDTGLPMGKVFAGTAMKLKHSWTITTSHELLEMLADPDINLTVFVQSEPTKGVLYAREVCDAVERDDLGYRIGRVEVSDFVFPAWFESFQKKGSAQFDFCKHVSRPFEILPGGYIGAFDVSSGTGWHQITAPGERPGYEMRPLPGSRRERRRTPRGHWVTSKVHFGQTKKESE